VISLWSLRHKNPFYKVVFNVCALPIAIWIGSQVFFAISGIQPLVLQSEGVSVSSLLFPLLCFTVVYFILNSSIIAIAISLERSVSAFRIWRDNFAWISLNYFGGASVAALLVSYTRQIEFSQLAIIVPLLLVSYLTFATSMGRAEDTNRHLLRLNQMYMATIETLAMAIDAKDQITHGHIRRVQTYATGLAQELGVRDEAQIRAIEAAALLHDMGKLGVPDYILNKPGPLSPPELDRMRLHASIGAEILSSIQFPYPVVPIVRHHHENWDGTGYPDALKGTEIPIGARILSVVDCFDALTSDRPYRSRLTDDAALSILSERRGTMYDPLVIDAFFRVHAKVAGAQQGEADVLQRPGLAAITEAASVRFRTDAEPTHRSQYSSIDMLAFYELAHSLAKKRVRSADVAELIAAHLRRLVKADVYAFFVSDMESSELVAVHTVGDDAASIRGMRIGLGQRLSGWVAVNRGTIVNSDPALDLGGLAHERERPLKNSLSSPLIFDGTLVGVITLYSERPFTQDDARVIEVTARHVAAALRPTLDSDNGASHALDKALGLPASEYAKRLLTEQMEAVLGVGEPMSLVLIRVVQESEGSTTERPCSGPQLATFALAIRQALRATDILFQLQPCELVSALPQTDESVAGTIAKRIENIAQSGLAAAAHPRVSLGISSAPQDGTSLDLLLSVAQSRLRQVPHLSGTDSGAGVHA
jgi:putative nucleotidyltransferase with HDIG domain